MYWGFECLYRSRWTFILSEVRRLEMVDQELTVDKRAVNHSEDTTHTAYLWTVGGDFNPFNASLAPGKLLLAC